MDGAGKMASSKCYGTQRATWTQYSAQLPTLQKDANARRVAIQEDARAGRGG